MVSVPRWLARWGRHPTVWYHPAFRLPTSGVPKAPGFEPRRADFALWALQSLDAVQPRDQRTPMRVSYDDLARVHTSSFLASLGEPETLAKILGVDPAEIVVDEVITTVRLACGATVGAAQECLATGGAALTLLGGFHHAAPDRAARLCAVNDVAVAVARLRADGFAGRVTVLDLDAHSPDGTAECLARDHAVWIGSLSGPGSVSIAGVDETTLPERCGDDAYLRALDDLLGRMPETGLAFVIAGGDVLDGDREGLLGLSVSGARERDVRVLTALDGTPSVWLPGGGYRPGSWRVLAGTGLVLSGDGEREIPADQDPLAGHFAGIAQRIEPGRLGHDAEITADDVEGAFGERAARIDRLLGFYSAAGVEHALFEYGILRQVERLGYQDLHVELDRTGVGDRMRLLGSSDGAQHCLVEVVLERSTLAGRDVLYIHWLTLRNPRASFAEGRPRLPGQDVPGLGLAPEALALMAQVARRLGLAGVASRASSYHVAFAARRTYRFADAARQARFEALQRDLGAMPLAELTTAIDEGRVKMNGAPYRWEPDVMVHWLDGEATGGAPPEPDVRFTIE